MKTIDDILKIDKIELDYILLIWKTLNSKRNNKIIRIMIYRKN